MRNDALSKLTKAGQAASDFVHKKWVDALARKSGDSAADESQEAKDAELARKIDEKNTSLDMIAAKLAGVSQAEMPPLEYSPETDRRAVYLVMVPIAYGNFELSRRSYDLVAKHVGMTLDSVSHWALAVVDRGLVGRSWCYDLMSDQIAISMLGKNYLRVYEVDKGVIETWSRAYYIGETTKSHDEIQMLGNEHLAVNPRYNLLGNNCQTLVEDLVKDICDGKLVSQAKLGEELSQLSLRMARDLMVARVRSKMDIHGESENSEDVQHDVGVIKSLWKRTRGRSPAPPEAEERV